MNFKTERELLCSFVLPSLGILMKLSSLQTLSLIFLMSLQGFALGKGPSSQNVRVRVLSWWGYIEPQSKVIQAIEKKCRASLSIDEFYSTSEFLERVSKKSSDVKSYDLLIYSDTAYESHETRHLRASKRKLNEIHRTYHPSITAFHKKNKYNAATAVFQISLSGFLVNQKLIQLHGRENLNDVFNLVGQRLFVFMDDHMEIATLLNKWECSEAGSACKKDSQLVFPSEDKLKKLVGQSKVVISSDLADITKHPKFALAYTWSGDALQKQSEQSNLNFILHPSLSHSSMDLLTLVGESQEAKCVANELISKKFVDSVAQKSKYFSPYGPVQSNDKAFNKLQQEFFGQFSTLGRIHRVTQQESLEIDKKWQLFKILFGSKI